MLSLHPEPAALRGDGLHHRLAQELVDRIDVVDAPVGHRPAGVIPEIAEGGEFLAVHAPAVLVKRNLGGAGPSHMSQSSPAGGRCRGGLPLPALSASWLPGLAPGDLAERALDIFLGLQEVGMVRCMVPPWTTRLYLRAAASFWGLRQRVQAGFST